MKILEVETQHVGPFKVLFEVLKEMLTDANIEFKAGNKTDKGGDDKDCMKINEVDPTKTVLINVKLTFDKFMCKKNRLLLGVNLGCFYKLIKSMGKNDILSLSQDLDEKNYLKIKIDSPEEKKDSIFNLKLIDVEEHKLQIPQTTFDAVITMNSQEFNKLCRDMNNIADYVEIKCLADKIVFTCKGEFADRTTTYRTRQSAVQETNKEVESEKTTESQKSKSVKKVVKKDEKKEVKTEVKKKVDTKKKNTKTKAKAKVEVEDSEEDELEKEVEVEVEKENEDDDEEKEENDNEDEEDEPSEDINENILVSITHASSKGKTAPQIVQGIFELKHLVLFSKCASLCNEIEIYMKNDFPLVIKFQVAAVGRILLCLTPIKEETTQNAAYSDEEEFYSDD